MPSFLRKPARSEPAHSTPSKSVKSSLSKHSGRPRRPLPRPLRNGPNAERIGAPLTALDFKFNFFPWWKAPEYQLDSEGIVIDDNFLNYFDGLKANHGITLREAQQAWYVKKSDTQLEDMKREFPSTPEEAFEASVEGAYYAQQMAKAELERRIGSFPAVEGHPVHCAWDIGVSDATAIWLFQRLIGAVRLVGYLRVLRRGP